MADLAARITAVLGERGCEPWFPGLTGCLTSREWKRLRKEIGLWPETYTTARMLRSSASTPRVIRSFEYSPSLTTPSIRIEMAPRQWSDSYRSAGVSFYSTHEIENTSVLECIGDALKIISQVPSLIDSVQRLVRSLHLIKPWDADHDVSFSEPHIPFSISVSVFEERVTNDALRVAEAIVHEAMHLQLTLIERTVAIVESNQCQHFSPWKREMRDSHGLLHAIYVFTVIHTFLSRLRSHQGLGSAFINARLGEIVSQMRDVKSFEECQALTPIGRRFVRNFLTLDQ
jgi:HEXXH motif-containing protein